MSGTRAVQERNLPPPLPSLTLAVVLVTLLAACAGARPVDGEADAAAAGGATPGTSGATTQDRALARYSAYAGPPVSSFNWLGRFDSWEPLGNDHVLVYTKPNEAYLLKVSGPCDVRFATGPLGITSTNSTVLARLDSIVVRNGPGGPRQCPIDEIHPVDVRRMRADERAHSPQSSAAER